MTTSTMPFVFFQGGVKPAGEAYVSLASNSLQYGTTCFAGIRGYVRDGTVKIFRLQDHHERLMNASKIMGYNYTISFEQFYAIIEELVYRNAPEGDFYIRPFIFAADEQLAPKPAGLNFDLAVYFVPLGHYYDPHKGMRLMVSSWRKFPDASFPTKAKAGGCYVNSFLASGEALRCGFDEALVMDHEGYVVEASVANLMMVYRERLILPELGSAQLEGITMRTIVELLQHEGFDVHYERMDRSMIYTCKELLLMGTAAQVAFADSVDGRKIGDGKPGPMCRLARARFQEVIEGSHPKAEQWVSAFSLSNSGAGK